MKFAENNRISHRQLFRQMILSLLAPFLLCMFGQRGINGVNGLPGTIIALIILCFYVVFLIRLAPCFGDLKKTAGPVLGRVTGTFFLIYILLAGAYLLSVLEELVPVSLVTGISGWLIGLLAIFVCSLGTHTGMQRRGRMAEVSGGFLLGGILLMMIFSAGQAKMEYFQDMIREYHFTGKNFAICGYGILCGFSSIGLLPFLLEDVEKYGSAGKTVTGAILTLGGILMAMQALIPSVLGYDRVRAEKYPVLPLMDGADLPGNVLARFDVLWMGFLLYSLLFAIGSLLHYGHQIIKKSHMGTGRVWMAVVIYILSLIEIEGMGIQDYFGVYLGYVFVPGLLLLQILCFVKSRTRYKKKTAAVLSCMLAFCLFFSGCASAVEPEKRRYPSALGVDEAPEGFMLTYGMPDLSQSTGQGKEEENGSAGVLSVSGADFDQIEEIYNHSQEKFLDMGHLQVLILGDSIIQNGKWREVLDYMKQEPFIGEDLYVFRADNAKAVLSWSGEGNSSVGEYITGLVENRMKDQKIPVVTLRDVFYEKYKSGNLPELPFIEITQESLRVRENY
ncbi:MAG: GerAB/ArcD/ProY family transporter [Clostridia bacterium]|nr:GerAB/ArcD/ProY family transporter [Clostridia bacterium]MDY5555523.1 GerAB/ArcD/ProY family transporter [Blautia sp.]